MLGKKCATCYGCSCRCLSWMSANLRFQCVCQTLFVLFQRNTAVCSVCLLCNFENFWEILYSVVKLWKAPLYFSLFFFFFFSLVLLHTVVLLQVLWYGTTCIDIHCELRWYSVYRTVVFANHFTCIIFFGACKWLYNYKRGKVRCFEFCCRNCKCFCFVYMFPVLAVAFVSAKYIAKIHCQLQL